MQRRSLVAAAAAAVATLAGCTVGSDGGDGGGSDDTPSPSATPTTTPPPTEEPSPTSEPSPTGEPAPTDDPSPTPEPTDTPRETAVTGQSFEVRRVVCGSGASRADVAVGRPTVTVEGTIPGRNGCYTAELADVGYDEGRDELTVAVRSFEREGSAACTECLVDIDYRATVEYEGRAPGSVRVRHNGSTVTTA